MDPELNPDLAAAPRGEALATAALVAAGRTVEPVIVPAEGLWLLRLAEPVRDDRFFVGEVPAAQAAVELRDPVLGACRGGAVLLHGDAEWAGALAVCDAVARSGWPGATEVATLRERGRAARRDQARMRAAIRERTRVSFAELGQEDAG
jgi:phosphonate C-P lyase system protein PhnG